MGIAERKQLEKSKRKKQILDCAFAVFRKKGFKDATIKDIADLAQISQGTIYLYFKSKADIYFNLTKPALETHAKHLQSIASNNLEAPDVKIRELMYAVYSFSVQDADAYNLVTRYKASEYRNLFPKDRLLILERLMRSNLKQMEIAIEEGIQKGMLKSMNPYMGAVVFWSSFIGIMQFQENRMMPGKTDYKKETLDQLIEAMLDGIRKK